MTTSPPAAPTALHDTSSISDYVRNPTASAASGYMRTPHVPAISFQTEGELLLWDRSSRIAPGERDRLRGFLASALVLQSNAAANRHFADIVIGWRIAHPQRTWRNLLIPDAWIAATALAYGLPLITFDRRDFLEIDGLRLIMPG